jgi:hypothetical protein
MSVEPESVHESAPKRYRLSFRAKLARRAVVCLILGAAATLATAWVPPFFQYRLEEDARSFTVVDIAGNRVGFLGHTIRQDAWFIDSADFGANSSSSLLTCPTLLIPRWLEIPPPPRRTNINYASGLPWRALRRVEHLGRNGIVETGCWLIEPPNRNWLRFPLLPIWPGLLANITFWSLIAAVSVCGVPALHRSRRARRGLCRNCGYSRQGLAPIQPCPECGG